MPKRENTSPIENIENTKKSKGNEKPKKETKEYFRGPNGRFISKTATQPHKAALPATSTSSKTSWPISTIYPSLSTEHMESVSVKARIARNSIVKVYTPEERAKKIAQWKEKKGKVTAGKRTTAVQYPSRKALAKRRLRQEGGQFITREQAEALRVAQTTQNLGLIHISPDEFIEQIPQDAVITSVIDILLDTHLVADTDSNIPHAPLDPMFNAEEDLGDVGTQMSPSSPSTNRSLSSTPSPYIKDTPWSPKLFTSPPPEEEQVAKENTYSVEM